ncbi:hypothetical protein GE061_007953 [Apolygus lucorum]|uniref:Uncharacterized protein n=1 Tax=Apolygus lucorum TaxID=248454 RepID=A0A6A4IKJ6_APOLU|nr:hypothetical protein GE061_007953 [Apolygus lucorum]
MRVVLLVLCVACLGGNGAEGVSVLSPVTSLFHKQISFAINTIELAQNKLGDVNNALTSSLSKVIHLLRKLQSLLAPRPEPETIDENAAKRENVQQVSNNAERSAATAAMIAYDYPVQTPGPTGQYALPTYRNVFRVPALPNLNVGQPVGSQQLYGTSRAYYAPRYIKPYLPAITPYNQGSG